MKTLAQRIDGATAFIQSQDPRRPDVGIILGSGLGQVTDEIARPVRIPYEAVPGFPHASVIGHAGEIVIGILSGKTAAVLNGRVHFYEGHDLSEVTFPVRVLHQLGCHMLVVTNAAGGINPELKAGDLMLIKDHINLVGLAGHNPLRGLVESEMGPRFVNMSAAYDPELRQIALSVAERLGQSLRCGVYAMVGGPSFETPAEIGFLRAIGADAVGMSTASEVIVARQCGMRVLGISCIANMAVGEAHHLLSHSEVLKATQAAVYDLSRLIRGVLEAAQ